MNYLYVCTQGSRVGVEGHRIIVRTDGIVATEIPIEPLESIELYGNIQMTVQAMQACMRRQINVGLYTASGFYIGKIYGVEKIGRPELIKAQIYRSGDFRFCLGIAKRIIGAKIHNQKVVLRKYCSGAGTIYQQAVHQMDLLGKRIDRSKSVEEIMGIEGMAARTYFTTVGQMLPAPFGFMNRSRRPAKDPFNALINFGYAVLQNQVEGKLEGRGLHPAVGMIHSSHSNKKALSYDLMEEWRPVIVDSLAIHCLRTHELREEHFQIAEDGEIRLTRDGMRIYRKKIDDRYETMVSYIQGRKMSFRRGIKFQTDLFARSILQNDAMIYEPCRIR